MDEFATPGWECGLPQTQEQPWHIVPERTSLKQMSSLDETIPVNYNDDGTSDRIVQLTSDGSSHQHPEPTTRFFSNLPANQIVYTGGEYDGEYGFGKACGDESEHLFERRSFGDTVGANLGAMAQACPMYELIRDSELWQPALFQDHLSVEGPTPQHRGFVENNSFQDIGYVQMNGNRMFKSTLVWRL